MISGLEKDKKKRFNFLKLESSRKVFKAISCNLGLPVFLRIRASLALTSLSKNSSYTRIKKRCVLTGRGRFVLGSFHLSRLMIRKLAKEGLIPGLRKSS